MKPIEVIVRAYDLGTDEAFLYSTWTRNCYYDPMNQPCKIEKKLWFKRKCDFIKALLPYSEVIVACFKDDPYLIVGYAVITAGKLEWLYIKKDYRTEGVEHLLTSRLKEKQNGREEREDSTAGSATPKAA